ncbi:DEKNAAC103135 [Brettanomyces naardenensis]|uniref:DEKNAAC103135 n=1 Tax=Brettanomyces naardenensis TaxID=13370 RepID=A0A448YML6_BRENA|nr:DEKNAAC103135 [Brettanomyces naardenensis]
MGSWGAPLLKEKVLIDIAEKHGVSAANVAISWGIQRGTVLIPRSVKLERIVSNSKIITLSDEDMERINSIQKVTKKRLVSPDWGIDVFNTDYRFNALPNAGQ